MLCLAAERRHFSAREGENKIQKKNNKGVIALIIVLVLAAGALEQENLIEGTESEYGLYVLTVDGETADENEQQWWGYSVNGTFAELGVDSQPIADGDVYDFVLNVGW